MPTGKPTSGQRILLAGATGLVGSAVLPLLLANARVGQVISLARRAQPRPHAKLLEWTAPDLVSALRDERADAVICCLGTTMKKAGSREAFSAVDKHLPLAIARWAERLGVPTFVIISAVGADPHSRFFYNRVKGEVEHALGAMRFNSLALMQPSVISGPRQERRPAEAMGLAALKLLAPLFAGPMAKYRLMPHTTLAKALVQAALYPAPGLHRYLYRGIMRLAGSRH